MKEIPISAAKQISMDFGYDQVVVIARRVGEGGGEHVTTYGVTQEHCRVAARMGDHLKYKVMEWERERENDDFTTQVGRAIRDFVEEMLFDVDWHDANNIDELANRCIEAYEVGVTESMNAPKLSLAMQRMLKRVSADWSPVPIGIGSLNGTLGALKKRKLVETKWEMITQHSGDFLWRRAQK